MTSQEKAQLLVNYFKAQQDMKQYYEQLKTVLTIDDWLRSCDSWKWVEEVDVSALDNILLDDEGGIGFPDVWDKCHSGTGYTVKAMVGFYVRDVFSKEVTLDKMVGVTVKKPPEAQEES